MEITKPEITGLSIADGSIGDSKLDRVTDPITIVNADIANLAVSNAKIADLSATKITAGTFIAGVIYAGNILAAQIQAGTMTAVNVSGGTYLLTSAPNTMQITGTGGFHQVNSSSGNETRIFDGQAFLSNGGAFTTPANRRLWLSQSGIQVYDDGGDGNVLLHNDGSSLFGAGLQADSGLVEVSGGGGSAHLGVKSTGGVLLIDGVQVVGPQQADPGASPTTEQLRQILLAHGLI